MQARRLRNQMTRGMSTLVPFPSDPLQRHTPASYQLACWLRWGRLDVPVMGGWPDPRPATMDRGRRDGCAIRTLLDSREGNLFHRRGTAGEYALAAAIRRAAPRPARCIQQPAPERFVEGAIPGKRADVAVTFAGDTGSGTVF